jgi:hypothetical protein
MVREEFDALEADFEVGLAEILEEAGRLRKEGRTDEASDLLDAYTASCTDRAARKANDLRERFAEQPIEIPAGLLPYIGSYIANFGQFSDAAFEVTVQGGRLAVDVPGQMVFELLDPDAEGLWYFALTNLVAVSFQGDGSGGVTSMRFHQTTELTPKEAEEDQSSEEVPEEYRPYVGAYLVPPGVSQVEVLFREGHLLLDIPRQATVELLPPDDKGRWYFSGDPSTALSFTRDESGTVTRMNLHRTFELPRAD